jgi:hypothetical protein
MPTRRSLPPRSRKRGRFQRQRGSPAQGPPYPRGAGGQRTLLRARATRTHRTMLGRWRPSRARLDDRFAVGSACCSAGSTTSGTSARPQPGVRGHACVDVGVVAKLPGPPAQGSRPSSGPNLRARHLGLRRFRRQAWSVEVPLPVR